MAALTDREKRLVRNFMEKKANEMGVPVRWIKDCMNNTAQAVEDALEAIKPSVAADMNAASSPYGVTFNAAEKKKIAAIVMDVKYVREQEGIS